VASARLSFGGLAFDGWVAAEITRSLEALASGFTFTLTDTPQAEARLVARPGSECALDIDGERYITGIVETFEVTTTADEYQLTVSGRSLTADIVDSDIIEPLNFRGQSAAQIASAIAALHGLGVVVDAEAAAKASAPLGRLRAAYGDSQREVLERVCRLAGLQLTDTPAGALRLTVGGSGRAPTALEVGRNVLESTVTADATAIFARISCRSQTALPGADDVEAWSTMAADIVEPLGARNRSTVIAPEQGMGRADCLARAQYEASTRAGRALTVTCTVAGWQLWTCGDLVRYTDRAAGFDGELVIAEITYRLSATEQTTELILRPAAAYLAEPPRTRRRQPGSGSRYWADLESYGAKVGRQ
jgi:prophage tail gpP-like protein